MQWRFAETDELPGWRPAGQARAPVPTRAGVDFGLGQQECPPHTEREMSHD
jgi:hypothetical protein